MYARKVHPKLGDVLFSLRIGVLIAGLLLFLHLSTAIADISGTVFRDVNLSGADDGALEPGIGGIIVTAYDSTGAIVGIPQTTACDGSYTLTGISSDVRDLVHGFLILGDPALKLTSAR